MVMCHTAVKLIKEFHNSMSLCEDARVRNAASVGASIPLGTVHDDKEDTAPGREARSKKMYKKKPLGRIKKWMGDLAMQVDIGVLTYVRCMYNT
ncbi:hypothetical protein EON63_20315 [archaeon]|nr:MAG: hypothetical protein EON63_20315 [archaeon]